MRGRSAIVLVSVVLCGAALWGVLAQGRQLSDLRAEQKRLQAMNPVTSAAPEAATTPLQTPQVPRELLQLRAEVARLSQQQRELTSERSENERLRLQVENRRTNSAAAKGASAGYVRTSEAKWLGYNSPENTLQSYIWAKKNHDLGKLLEALAPNTAEQAKDLLQNSYRTPEQLFGDRELPPAYRIAGRQERDNDYVGLAIEIAPDLPAESFDFELVGGQWKLQGLH